MSSIFGLKHSLRKSLKMDIIFRARISLLALKKTNDNRLWDKCGRGRIRTYGRVTPPSVFKTDAIGHSATLP